MLSEFLEILRRFSWIAKHRFSMSSSMPAAMAGSAIVRGCKKKKAQCCKPKWLRKSGWLLVGWLVGCLISWLISWLIVG